MCNPMECHTAGGGGQPHKHIMFPGGGGVPFSSIDLGIISRILSDGSISPVGTHHRAGENLIYRMGCLSLSIEQMSLMHVHAMKT